MANIGATTAFYKVETALTRANSEVSKSMERLATGKANANAGDRSSYVAMADTFRLDFVGTKAGIKGASVVMGYLETGMRVLDSASALLSRLQELAVLGANDTNTTADHEAINLEAEAIADEFNRLMTTSTYKGRNIFVDTASSLYVSMGGRDQEMTFGVGTIDYKALYNATATTIAEANKYASPVVDGPNKGSDFNLAHLPSDAVVEKSYGRASNTDIDTNPGPAKLLAGRTYVMTSVMADGDTTAATDIDMDSTADTTVHAQALALAAKATKADGTALSGNLAVGSVIKMGAADHTYTNTDWQFKEVVNDSTVFLAGHEYEVISMGDSDGNTATANSDAEAILDGTSVTANFTKGQKFTVNADISADDLAKLNALTQKMTFRMSSDTVTKDIESIQALVNTARVQAGSQYAAIESAVNYTTDLTAQYELGYNTVNDVNFSMETAHLAKNQILQQAATAMLAQANSGQQGLLQLIS
jgi:flagellin